MREPSELPRDPALLAKLARVASRTESAVAIGDASGCVEWVNPAFERITGYSAAEIQGKRLDLLRGLHPGEPAFDWVLSRFQQGQPARLEIPARSRSGQELWLAIEVQPLGTDEGFIAIAIDITERKRAERGLAESEERYRQLVELSPNPIGVHCEGRWVFLNPLAARLLGAETPEKLLGRPVMDFVHPDSREAVAERIARVVNGETVEPLADVRVLRVDGRTVLVEIAGAPVTDAGRPAVQLVARDLTPRRRAERLERAAWARRQEAEHAEKLAALAGGLGDDFNDLLGTVLGEVDQALSVLAEGGAPEESLHAVRRESLRGSRISRQILSYAGRRALVRRRLDLSRLVMQTCELLEAAVSGRTLLDLDLAGNLPPVLADSRQLQEVVANLVHNAAEALEGEEGAIRVRTSLDRSESQPGEARTRVLLEVSDTGGGMDRATLARVFDPFFSTRRPGRGLGLSAVQGIVRAHEGALRITSRPGSGTRVTVRLPCAPRQTRKRARRRRASRDRVARTLLWVEADPAPHDAARATLQEAGYRVVDARGSEDALGIFRARSPELRAVLLDLTLPGGGSAKLLRELRLVRPDVRVLLLQGYDDAVDGIPSEDLSGALAKPYEPGELLGAVRRTLER